MSQAAAAYYQARQRELQAILRPLLEFPRKPDGGAPDEDCGACIFCECIVPLSIPGSHEPTCPVLRKDELLR